MKMKTINKSQAAVLKALARISIDEALGGKNSVSYELLSPICKIEMSLELGYNFGAGKIENIPAADFDDAIDFLLEWEPSVTVREVSDEIEEDFAEFRYRYVDELPPDSPAYKQMKEDYLNALCSDAEGLD
ncbi:MAG: ORF6C domain-containing protein [Ruminiclostridium sp.]|nr:ORF6C domain-containing protein [Ruminiclostridium sp.]